MTKHNSYTFLAALLIFLFFFLSIFHEITFPFIVGLAIAYTFAPLVDKAQYMLSRALVSAIITLSIVSMFILFIFTCAPKIENQVQVIIKNAYNYSDSIVSFCNNMLESLHLQPIDMVSLQNFFVRKIDLIISFIMKIFAKTGAITSFFSYMIIIPVSMFYFMKDWNRFTSTVRSCIPTNLRTAYDELSDRIRSCLCRFCKGQLCVALCLAIYYSIGLSILRLDNAVVLGYTTGLMSFIPFVGAVICGIIAFIIGILSDFSVVKLAAIACIYTIGPLLESYVFMPRFVGEEVGLHPLWVLFSFFAGIHLFGIVGVAIALPSAAVLSEICKFAFQEVRKKSFFKAI